MSKRRVFISYSSCDRKTVEKIVENFIYFGFDVWYDKNIGVGEEWWKKILFEIKERDFLAFIISENSLESEACKSEYEYAIALNKHILPILIDKKVDYNLIPIKLRDKQILDYKFKILTTEGAWKTQLTKSINSREDEERSLPNPMPKEPIAPTDDKLCTLIDKINTKEGLAFNEQQEIVSELKDILYTSSKREGAIKALARLKKTSYVAKAIETEIDDLLESNGFDLKKYLPIIIGAIVALVGVYIGIKFFSTNPQSPEPTPTPFPTLTPQVTPTITPFQTSTPLPIQTPGATPTPAISLLKICGSNMLNHEIMPDLVEKFLKEQNYSDIRKKKEHNLKKNIFGTKDGQQYKVEIKADGTRNGYDDLKNKTCDIAVSYGEMSKERAKNFNEDSFAFDAITVVVNKENRIDSLSSHQIRKIFHGDISDWSEIPKSGRRGEIVLYTMRRKSGIYHEFVHDLTKNGHNLNIKTHEEFSSHEELEKKVAITPNAIGFVSNEHVTPNVKGLALNESGHLVYPTASKIISEEYDLYDELFLYTRLKPVSLEENFRVFIDKDSTQEWIANNTKLIAADIITESELEDEERERKSILNYQRLNSNFKNIMQQLVKTPVNFHFETGKNRVDHEVNIHLRQLNYLLNKHPEYKNKEIVIIGFSDSEGGDSEQNRRLSKLRAETVHTLLNDKNIIASHKMEVCGFGAHMPLLLERDADNEHERRVDRRVEIWIDAKGTFRSSLCD